MILPIALKYNKMGILESVRCLYFDIVYKNTIPGELAPKIQGYIPPRGSYAGSFYRNARYANSYDMSITRAEHSADAAMPVKSPTLQICDTQPDSQYAFLNYLSFATMDIANCKTIEYPADEYISKYGTILKTRKIAIINGNNQLVQDAIQVIAPKLALFRNYYDYNFLRIRQETMLLPTNGIVSAAQYPSYLSDYAGDDWFDSNIIYHPGSGLDCMGYYVTSAGIVNKIALGDEGVLNKLKQGSQIGNITAIKTDGITTLYEGHDTCVISKSDIAYNLTKTDLDVSSGLQGLSNGLEEDYSPAILNTHIKAIMPAIMQRAYLNIPANYQLKQLRCPELTPIVNIKSEAILDTLVLPKYADKVKLDLNGIRNIVQSTYTYNKFQLKCKNYLGESYDCLATSDKLDIDMHSSVLKQFNLWLSDDTGIASTYDGTVSQVDTDIEIDAPNLQRINVRRLDANTPVIMKRTLSITTTWAPLVIDLDYPIYQLHINFKGSQPEPQNRVITVIVHNSMHLIRLKGINYGKGIINLECMSERRVAIQHLAYIDPRTESREYYPATAIGGFVNGWCITCNDKRIAFSG